MFSLVIVSPAPGLGTLSPLGRVPLRLKLENVIIIVCSPDDFDRYAKTELADDENWGRKSLRFTTKGGKRVDTKRSVSLRQH
jgi:hypothetical protein